MEYTIRELAEEFHVSKQAINQLLTTNFRARYVSKKKINGHQTIVIDDAGHTVLANHFGETTIAEQPTPTHEVPPATNDRPVSPSNPSDQRLIEALTQEVALLTDQIEAKDVQLANRDLQLSTQADQLTQLISDNHDLKQLLANEQSLVNQGHLLLAKDQPEQPEPSATKPAKKHWWSNWFSD